MPNYETQCRGKIGHQTAELAQSALDAVKREGKKKKGYILHTYLCTFCALWHVGHRSKRKMKRFGTNSLANPLTITEVNPNAVARQKAFSRTAGA